MHSKPIRSGFAQLCFSGIPEQRTCLAAVPPLPQGLVIAQLAQARPCGCRRTGNVEGILRAAKMKDKRLTNFVEMHQFVLRVPYGVFVTSEHGLEVLITRSVLRYALTKAPLAICSFLLRVVDDLTSW